MAHPFFKLIALDTIAKKQDILVIEVGSWKGLSTTVMADHMKDSGIRGRIIAIDTWLGSPEHLTWGSSDLGKRELGFPQLYKQFLGNVQQKKLEDYIYPLPISSTQGAHFLEQSGIRADIMMLVTNTSRSNWTSNFFGSCSLKGVS